MFAFLVDMSPTPSIIQLLHVPISNHDSCYMHFACFEGDLYEKQSGVCGVQYKHRSAF